ncbi:hypothetical protein FD20_GL001152 [Liquorilactobacillus uvarum DSM 19971]|uniref:Uncharacterized protein n=2 Tax=Liquorilactobacillus uvarum TaxID=303240 RepID=A0A0R1PVT5_9LACO|nr:hypothetical protein FD20_GL001152 [Liquorilactobacillus uvarum DSM 19971]
MKIDSYVTATHRIMNALNISGYEASNLLYDRLINHRLKNMTAAQVMKQIEEKNNSLKWLITYSGKDVKRNELQDKKRQEKVREELKKYDTGIIQLTYSNNTLRPKDREKIIALLPKIFRNHKTAEWCAYLLKYGELETRHHYKQTHRQVQLKLNDLEKQCNRHRERMINIVLSKREKEIIAEEDVLKEFTQLLESESYTDEQMQDLINEEYAYIEDLMGTVYMKNPKMLLDSFMDAVNTDKYIFCNVIYGRIKELERKMIEG